MTSYKGTIKQTLKQGCLCKMFQPNIVNGLSVDKMNPPENFVLDRTNGAKLHRARQPRPTPTHVYPYTFTYTAPRSAWFMRYNSSCGFHKPIISLKLLISIWEMPLIKTASWDPAERLQIQRTWSPLAPHTDLSSCVGLRLAAWTWCQQYPDNNLAL